MSFGDICEANYTVENKTNETSYCLSYYQEILRKGAYSSTLKNWDYMLTLIYDFYGTERTSSLIYSYYQVARMKNIHAMLYYFLEPAFLVVIEKLKLDFDDM